jgi:YesN/AraC family two-component response regulator
MTDKKTVLVVDDSLVSATQIEKIIDGLDDFKVVGRAANGAEAIRLFEKLSPDVVCMDIMMPVMDGLEAARVMLRLKKDAKIILVTSLGSDVDRVTDALKVGIHTTIAKPANKTDLLAALRAACKDKG